MQLGIQIFMYSVLKKMFQHATQMTLKLKCSWDILCHVSFQEGCFKYIYIYIKQNQYLGL